MDYLNSSIEDQKKIIEGLEEAINKKRDQIREAQKERKIIAKKYHEEAKHAGETSYDFAKSESWLGREDSNPYYTVQSRMSYP